MRKPSRRASSHNLGPDNAGIMNGSILKAALSVALLRYKLRLWHASGEHTSHNRSTSLLIQLGNLCLRSCLRISYFAGPISSLISHRSDINLLLHTGSCSQDDVYRGASTFIKSWVRTFAPQCPTELTYETSLH
jgi:hypothetical protein